MADKPVLIMSVGGAFDQLEFSLDNTKCEYVIFICTTGTLERRTRLRQTEKFRGLKDDSMILLESHEDLTSIVRQLSNEIPSKLAAWKMSLADCTVDYTGGTKAIVAGLVLSTIDGCNEYVYISGTKRDGDEVGKVISGNENRKLQSNPWETLRKREIEQVDVLLGKSRYEAAKEVLNEVGKRIDDFRKNIFIHLSQVAEFYEKWDAFELAEAKKMIARPLQSLRKEAEQSRLPEMKAFLDRIAVSQVQIEGYWEGESLNERKICIDIVSNAGRRAKNEGKYEDAVARLYSALEKDVHFRLCQYGIDNSCADPADIPEPLKEEFKKYTFNETPDSPERMKFGFQSTCQVLSVLDEEFRKLYVMSEAKVEKIMNIRNSSILAHGTTPVRKKTYEKMMELTLDFMDITQNDLIVFPDWEIRSWGTRI